MVVLDDIYSQETQSTREFSLDAGMANSWQIAYPIQVRSRPGDDFDATDSDGGGGGGSGGLSTSAIVGIVFGALAFVALFVLAVFFLLLRKRRAQAPGPGPGPWSYGPGYAQGYAQGGAPPQWKLAMGRVPLPTAPGVHELNPPTHVAPELHSTPAPHSADRVYEMGPNVRPPELGAERP